MFDSVPASETGSTSSIKAAPRAVHVEVTGSARRLAALKPCWQRLERADPGAHAFLSWAWLHRALRDNPGAWRVIVIREAPEGDALALLPLSSAPRWNAEARRFETALGAAGDLIGGGPGGFLCAEGKEGLAIQALAEALASQPWATLDLHGLATGSRNRRLARALAQRGLQIAMTTSRADAWRLALPATEADWRAGSAGKALSDEIDRAAAAHLGRGKWQLGLSRGTRQMQDIAALTTLAAARWAPVLGAEAAERRADDARAILTNAALSGNLLMPVLRAGAALIGGIAHLLDHEGDTVHVLLDGLPSPDTEEGRAAALLLRSRAVAWSIAHGFTGYEFGPRPHADAERFGAGAVSRPDLHVQRQAGALFDPQSAPTAMSLVADMVARSDADATTAARALAAGRA